MRLAWDSYFLLRALRHCSILLDSMLFIYLVISLILSSSNRECWHITSRYWSNKELQSLLDLVEEGELEHRLEVLEDTLVGVEEEVVDLREKDKYIIVVINKTTNICRQQI